MTLPSRDPAHRIRPTLVFQHGWAFDASFWTPLRDALSAWPQQTLDRGYFADAATAATVVPTNGSGPLVWIGHSFGFMQGLATIAAGSTMAGLISINGFPRFSAAPDFTHGVPPRMVDRMATKLRTQTGLVVDDFRQRCGAAPRGENASPAYLDPLLADLLALRDDDHRATLQAYAGPVLALATRGDPIVPEAMTQTAFADREIAWCHGHPAGAGHLLPATDPAWCAQHIDDFLRRNWA